MATQPQAHIIASGGTKGGVGKTTLATNLAIMRANAGNDVLLVDADSQETSSDFTLARNEALEEQGGAGYTAVKLTGGAVRTDTLKLATKYDDIIIDVGGRDTAAQRAALSVADIYLVPFLPASFDVWTLEKVSLLVEEARAFNETLQVFCILNRADPGHSGSDNEEAAAIAGDYPQLTYLDAPIVNRKAFRKAAAQGLAVTELKGQHRDKKAIEEIQKLYNHLFKVKVMAK